MIEAPEALHAPTPYSALELSSRNTSLALERTRMGADRTLMAVIRTSLSLISFRVHDIQTRAEPGGS